ncbi:MAG: aromatic amino acid DMT transporter YddG [Bifidobacterium merycicum]|nr:aromatic amino acid DMT transporter YddG [Bifidobacterium merycicum]MEE1294372.1 aromatic amino acid DMT transporter YddG [Bifidobacterium merycicum]
MKQGNIIGLCAILLWGFMAGLVRIVANDFGATLGSALIYTVGGAMLLIVRKPAPIRRYPRRYLLVGGLMFVFYEASISLAIGLAFTSAQSIEVSLINYLWPSLLVLMTAAFSRRKGAVWRALPGVIIVTIGIALAVGGDRLDINGALANIANPLPYLLALLGAFVWSLYATVAPAMSGGYDGTAIFICFVAVTLWIIHFASVQGVPDRMPSFWGFVAVVACAISIAGGYACWGYGMLHGDMEVLSLGSYATPVLSTASSMVLLGVALGASFWIGVALVVGGTLVNVWLGKPAPRVSDSGESDV